MSETKKKPNQIIMLTLILCIVSAVVSLVLGLVDYVTRDRIKEINEQKTASSFSEVLVSDSYELIEGSESGSVTGIYKAGESGYVVQMNVSGAQGMIDMVVGIDNAGYVTGVSIISHSETSGLGSKMTEAGFRSQFIGAGSHVTLDKSGGEIATISGATITTKAVADAVNLAIDAVKALL